MAKIIITEEMHKRILKMMHHTYEQIGYDLPHKMKGTHLREVVADTDHMMFHGADKEAYEFWLTIPRTRQDKILREAFPHKWYLA